MFVGSTLRLMYAMAMLVFFHIMVVAHEEPERRRRFGAGGGIRRSPALAVDMSGFMGHMRRSPVWTEPKPREMLALEIRDDDDAWVLASAVVGEADALVTGDKDLLDVAEAAPLPILSPRDGWQWLRDIPLESKLRLQPPGGARPIRAIPVSA